eukprot:TRINITY_DN5143_c0_g1_i10.p1 TRINITY_DN5143_c0_g1~~TRINITY_DN5143_c0_g1_i10.p1  ORF type:complete len:136 (-),score=18.79 TRINITY_DN5143_c0_g1_i10:177-536(-)
MCIRDRYMGTAISYSNFISVGPSKESPNMFVLTFKGRSNSPESIVFECDDPLATLKSLKQFLVQAQEEVVKRRKEEDDVGKDKGLLTQIKTFFTEKQLMQRVQIKPSSNGEQGQPISQW